MSLSDIQQMWIAGAQTPSGKLQPYCFVVRGGGVPSSPAQQAQKVMEGGLSFQGKSTFPIRCFSSVVHVLGSCGTPLPLRKAEPQKLELAQQRSRRRKTPTVETTSKSSHTARGRDTASCCVEGRRISDFYMLADIIATLAILARRYHYRGQLASKRLHRNFNDVSLAFSSW